MTKAKPASAKSNGRPRLSPGMIRQLEEIRVGQRMSFRRFRTWMAAPFSAVTLRSALLGRPLWKPNHDFLVKFVKQLRTEPDATPDTVEVTP